MVSAFSVPDRLCVHFGGKKIPRSGVERDAQIRQAGFRRLRQKEDPLVVFRVLRVSWLNDEVDSRAVGGKPRKFEFALVRFSRVDVQARDPRLAGRVLEAAQYGG